MQMFQMILKSIVQYGLEMLSDEKNRIDYVIDLTRVERFKKFITKEEIRSIPFLPC